MRLISLKTPTNFAELGAEIQFPNFKSAKLNFEMFKMYFADKRQVLQNQSLYPKISETNYLQHWFGKKLADELNINFCFAILLQIRLKNENLAGKRSINI